MIELPGFKPFCLHEGVFTVFPRRDVAITGRLELRSDRGDAGTHKLLPVRVTFSAFSGEFLLIFHRHNKPQPRRAELSTGRKCLSAHPYPPFMVARRRAADRAGLKPHSGLLAYALAFRAAGVFLENWRGGLHLRREGKKMLEVWFPSGVPLTHPVQGLRCLAAPGAFLFGDPSLNLKLGRARGQISLMDCCDARYSFGGY